ncbi:MAG: ABC transporter ATP-binding protein [Clostridiales bacterium]|nr:ABC transporter ATP-binding protein [Clostridiales bacterium]
MQRNILEARQISKTFHLGETKVEALDQVDLSINEGEVVAIVGKSGAGKTTLLNILGGLEIPDSGDVIVDGESLYDGINDNRRTEIRREKIGYIFQTFCLIDEIRVLENIRLPFDIQNKAYDLDYEQQLISMLQLEKKMRYYPHKLSGGERQRVAIARALLMKPAIVLADEPTGNLDSETGNQFMGYLYECRERFGQTIIIVTHDMEIANQADRKIIVKDGNLVEG